MKNFLNCQLVGIQNGIIQEEHNCDNNIPFNLTIDIKDNNIKSIMKLFHDETNPWVHYLEIYSLNNEDKIIYPNNSDKDGIFKGGYHDNCNNHTYTFSIFALNKYIQLIEKDYKRDYGDSFYKYFIENYKDIILEEVRFSGKY